ncbi:hypothetical protein [Acidicapsa ligni]|uniref:hypothetical protein n=1 Tax=Acidicapsa ligni TaxID=542300 RepID=UPI0021DFAC8B|nr:hypothetical protein [Acidicapsa ligni]
MTLLLGSVTSCLALACRAYLCAPLVDCDPVNDPDCGPTGKKVLVSTADAGARSMPGDMTTTFAGAGNSEPGNSGSGLAGAGLGSSGLSSSGLKEIMDENLSRK